jgi:hypothetical protein
MKKTAVTIALLAFAVVSVAVLVVKELRHRGAVRAAEGARAAIAATSNPTPGEAAPSSPLPAPVVAPPPEPTPSPAVQKGPDAPKGTPKRAKPEPDRSNAAAAPPSATATPASAGGKLIVYYFHTTTRCPSCLKIEQFTDYALKEGFGAELATGRIEWRVVNTDDASNAHYIEDYKLYTKSVVLSRVEKGRELRWKNLDQVWKLLGDSRKFQEYVVSEVKGFLGEGS